MKLFASLLTTVGITGAVWGLLHIQPAVADASTEQPINSTAQPIKKVHRGFPGKAAFIFKKK
ncbi:hypothetical protein AB6D80_23760, partial [Vibrio sp. 10N.247.310.17]